MVALKKNFFYTLCTIWCYNNILGIYTNIEKEIVNQTVAVKIFSRKKDFNVEFAVFHALNAETDPNIEQYGIPRVYYRGPMLNSFYCIVMTMFDDNLEEYYDDKENNITDITMLSFFKQAVCSFRIYSHELLFLKLFNFFFRIEMQVVGLKYLNGRNIVHNDIKPQNLFLRGQKLFISGKLNLAFFETINLKIICKIRYNIL